MVKTKVIGARLTEEEIVEVRRRGGATAVIRAALSESYEEPAPLILARSQTEGLVAKGTSSSDCKHRWKQDPKMTGIETCMDCWEKRVKP